MFFLSWWRLLCFKASFFIKWILRNHKRSIVMTKNLCTQNFDHASNVLQAHTGTYCEMFSPMDTFSKYDGWHGLSMENFGLAKNRARTSRWAGPKINTQEYSCVNIGPAAHLLPSSYHLHVVSHNGRAYAINICMAEGQTVAGNYMEIIYQRLTSHIEQRMWFMSFMRKRF